jgi:hypothetical protein
MPFNKGEVTELVPVPDFKSAVSWLWSGKVSSILMLSRQFFKRISSIDLPDQSPLFPSSTLLTFLKSSDGETGLKIR